jgi:phosphotransferase system  glucose/maltose/N-acetylglucosamine-specific IIC component
MGRAIIAIAHMAALLLMIAITAGGGLVGYIGGRRFFGGGDTEAWTALGSIVGFLVAAFLVAFFITLTEIERNTRRIGDLIEKAESEMRRRG